MNSKLEWPPSTISFRKVSISSARTASHRAAARRQSEEELGLKLDESRLFRLCEFVGDYCMCTVYLANQDVSADELELRKDEVASVDFVSADMLVMFSDSGEFSSAPYLPMVISAMRVIERRHHT